MSIPLPGATATLVVPGDPYGAAPPPFPAPGGSGYATYESAARAGYGDSLDTPEAPVAVTTLGGRPVRPRGRGYRGARRRWSRRG